MVDFVWFVTIKGYNILNHEGNGGDNYYDHGIVMIPSDSGSNNGDVALVLNCGSCLGVGMVVKMVGGEDGWWWWLWWWSGDDYGDTADDGAQWKWWRQWKWWSDGENNGRIMLAMMVG